MRAGRPNPRGSASVNWGGLTGALSVRSTGGSVRRAAVNHTPGFTVFGAHTKALPYECRKGTRGFFCVRSPYPRAPQHTPLTAPHRTEKPHQLRHAMHTTRAHPPSTPGAHSPLSRLRLRREPPRAEGPHTGRGCAGRSPRCRSFPSSTVKQPPTAALSFIALMLQTETSGTEQEGLGQGDGS